MSVYLPNITKTLGGPAGWDTPFIVQNTGTALTTLDLLFYRFADGECSRHITIANVAPGTSFAYDPVRDGTLPGDTQYAVVVRSSLSAIVATVNQVQGSGSSLQALSYAGTSYGTTTVYLPNVTRRFYGWDVPFIVQNLGNVVASVTTLFTSITSASCTSPHSYTRLLAISPARSVAVDPNAESSYRGQGTGLMDGCQYSVVLTSTAPIAVVANAHNETGAPTAYSHNGVGGGSRTLYAPYAAVGRPDGRFSPIVVQNVGSAATNVSLEFTPLGGGSVQTFTVPSIAANASVAFDPRYASGDASGTLCAGAPSPTCLGSGEYSVRLIASSPIAAVVLPVTATTTAAYTAATSGQRRSYLPNVTRRLGGVNGWTTPLVVQSVTATAITVKWYRFIDATLAMTQNITISPGSALMIDPRSVSGLADGWQYSVVVDGGAPGAIAAIVYEQSASGGDGEMIYEGFAMPWASIPSPSGTAVVNGMVRWYDQPIAGMPVRLVHHDPVFISAVAITDSEGNFRIPGVAAGWYLVAPDRYPPQFNGSITFGDRPIAEGAEVTFGAIQMTLPLTITAPVDGALVSSPFLVRWLPVDRATSYTVWVYPTGATNVPTGTRTTATEFTVTADLVPGSSYEVSVQANAPLVPRDVIIASGRIRVTAK